MMVFAGRDLDSYLAAFERRTIPSPRTCPACGGRLHKHGHYRRKAERGDQPVWVPIQRMRCFRCRKTCSVLPSLFIPRHSMTTPQRERVAVEAARGSRGAA